MPEASPLHQRPGEGARAFDLFRRFLSLGPVATLEDTARETGKSVGYLRKLSAQFAWRERRRLATPPALGPSPSLARTLAERLEALDSEAIGPDDLPALGRLIGRERRVKRVIALGLRLAKIRDAAQGLVDALAALDDQLDSEYRRLIDGQDADVTALEEKTTGMPDLTHERVSSDVAE